MAAPSPTIGELAAVPIRHGLLCNSHSSSPNGACGTIAQSHWGGPQPVAGDAVNAPTSR